jgi:regulatory protein
MSYPRKDFSSDQPKKTWSFEEALVKAAAYCAYQERCQKEVRDKLNEMGIYGDKAEEVLSDLISEGFLNEERFARAFVRGKFRIKNWGKIKIRMELQSRQLSQNCINLGFKEIDDRDYFETLINISSKKWMSIKENDVFKKRHKVYQYLIGRGFESDLIQEVIAEHLNS